MNRLQVGTSVESGCVHRELRPSACQHIRDFWWPEPSEEIEPNRGVEDVNRWRVIKLASSLMALAALAMSCPTPHKLLGQRGVANAPAL